MLINACNLATGNDKAELEAWITTESFDKAEKIKAVTAIYDKLGVGDLALKKIEKYFDIAKGYLSLVKVDAARKEEIGKYAVELMHRNS